MRDARTAAASRRPGDAGRAVGTGRVLFLNRSYRPDVEATGQLLTELTEDLAAAGWRVGVICGRPNANPDGSPADLGSSRLSGVRVRRVWHTRLAGASKKSLPLRAVDYLTFLAAALLRGLVSRPTDVVVAETDPFPLAVVGRLLAWRHGAKFVVHAQDVHPELGVALGVLRNTPLVRVVRGLMHASVRSADAVVTLSGDMRRTFEALGVAADRVAVLPNWADAEAVRPVRAGNPFRRAHDLGEPGEPGAKFVVMHSGNMGRTQRLGVVLDAAERLKEHPRVRFLLVGGGANRDHLRAEADRRGLANLRFLPYQPKDRLAESLSAADLHLICTDARVIPYLMPSKLYGVLAAGVPAVCVAPRGSELAAAVSGEPVGGPAGRDDDLGGGEGARCGWVCEPDDPAALADAIADAADRPTEELHALGDAGRDLLETRYSREHVTPRFDALLRAVRAGDSPVAAARPRPSTLALPAAGDDASPARRAA